MSVEIKYWLALKKVNGVGNILFKELLNKFKQPRAVLEAPLKILEETPGIGKKTAESIRNFKDWEWVEREISLTKKHSVDILTANDENFPKALCSIPDAPPYLYVKGTICGQDDTAIAIVGTRHPTYYGVSSTERIARELAGWGITIVSGMARGIDTSAHKGALAGNGRTVAVLGSGIDVIYPPENKKIYEQIIESGAVVSEFPMGSDPKPENFPQRNRIISGLAIGVLVAEATLRSGSLITAQLALDYGRDVFALPGSITSATSKGTNKLIKDGAKLVEDARDILEEYSIAGKSNIEAVLKLANKSQDSSKIVQPNLSPEERNIIGLLDEPNFIDTIIQKTGISAQKISAILLDMELKGFVKQLAGKQFIRSV